MVILRTPRLVEQTLQGNVNLAISMIIVPQHAPGMRLLTVFTAMETILVYYLNLGTPSITLLPIILQLPSPQGDVLCLSMADVRACLTIPPTLPTTV